MRQKPENYMRVLLLTKVQWEPIFAKESFDVDVRFHTAF